MKRDEFVELAGITESDFVAVVDEILDTIISSWTFGYYDDLDIRQEGHIIALKAIRTGRYDKAKNIKPFLYTCLNNGLFNLKRNVTGRFASPCERCPLYDKHCNASHNQCTGFSNKMDCKKFKDWTNRNIVRTSIMHATPFSEYEGEMHGNYNDSTPDQFILDELTKNEITELINQNLSPQLRGIFLRMVADIKVKVADRKKVQDAIYNIIKDSGLFSHLLEGLEYVERP